jgi:hypothetical protein
MFRKVLIEPGGGLFGASERLSTSTPSATACLPPRKKTIKLPSRTHPPVEEVQKSETEKRFSIFSFKEHMHSSNLHFPNQINWKPSQLQQKF